MNTIRSLLSVIIVTIILGGCETVTSIEHIGIAPVKIIQQEWQGSWLVDNNGVLHTKVTNSDKGELILYIVNLEGKSDKDILESYKVSVRKTGSNHYFNLVEKNHDGQEHFFAKFIRNGNTIKVYLPDYEYFSKTISAGDTPGTVNKESSGAVLKGSSSEINNFIESHPEGFASKEPSILKKLGN